MYFIEMYFMAILSLRTINKDNTQLLRDNILSIFSLLLSIIRILKKIILSLDK
jgi:hypothetical protein